MAKLDPDLRESIKYAQASLRHARKARDGAVYSLSMDEGVTALIVALRWLTEERETQKENRA